MQNITFGMYYSNDEMSFNNEYAYWVNHFFYTVSALLDFCFAMVRQIDVIPFQPL